MEACENCKRLYKTVNEKQGQLFCRRYPPIPLLVPVRSFTNESVLGIQPTYPPVKVTDYCGKFIERLQND